MADADGAQDRSLNAPEALAENARAWEFFAAVRAMQAARGTRPPVGRSTRVDQDFLRFKQEPSLSFEPMELLAFGEAQAAGVPAWQIRQIFFGFFGPNGPLPNHVTEDAISDLMGADKSRLMPDFLDIFQHRLTSLLYRAWESGQLAASRDVGDADPWKRRLASFYGEATPGMEARESLSDDAKRFMSGHLGARRGSIAELESVTCIVTGVPAKVEQFVGEWLDIPEADQSRMGSARLGVDTTIGARAFSGQSRIAIRTERLNFEQYQRLLPDGEAFEALRDAVRHVIGLGMAWELRPILKVADIPKCSLDGNRRLGWDTWVAPEERMRDGDELALEGTLSPLETRRAAAAARSAYEEEAQDAPEEAD